MKCRDLAPSESFTRYSFFHSLLWCLFYLSVLFPSAAAATFFFFSSHWYSDTAASRWQSVKERGGGCHLSVKAALPSSRPGVLGQLASELASVTVVEWTLNNRAYSSALPAWLPGRLAGWLAGWRAGVTRQDGGQSQLQSITFTWGRVRERERGGGEEIELRARAPFSSLFCMLISATLSKGIKICWMRKRGLSTH